ncbi:MAG: lipase family protein, partial [Thermoleophilaceae bacterium]
MAARIAARATVAFFLLAAGASAQSIPPPDDDPFYAQPSAAELEAQPPGTILRSREVTITGLGVPVPVSAWQVAYRSADSKSNPILAVATVIVPLTPYPAGPRPLVSYQMAIDALGTQCNPSYTMRTGTQKEMVGITNLIDKGWAVVVPDFEGPRMAYTAGHLAAYTVLDGIRAAKAFETAGLAEAPIGLWGYSGGGQGTAWAVEQHPGYAPELEIAAAAQGGVPPNLEQVARKIDGGPFFGVYFGASVGLSRAFPEVRLDDLLNDKGKALKEEISTQCAEDFILGYPNEKMSDYTTVPDPLVVPRVREVMETNTLGQEVPTAPIYMYHSIADELIPVEGPDALFAEYCSEGVQIYYQRDVAGEHIAYAFTGAPAAIAYLAARFAGGPVLSNCPAGSAQPPPAEEKDSCTSGRAIKVRAPRGRGEHIRRITALVKGKRVARRRGDDLRRIRIQGLEPGRHKIKLKIRSNYGKRAVTVHRMVPCMS